MPWPLAQAGGIHIAGRGDREDPRDLITTGAVPVGKKLGDPRPERTDFVLEFEDASDAGQGHALVLRESLNLTQHGDIALAVSTPTTAGAGGRDQA
jgi:hypothetical protein